MDSIIYEFEKVTKYPLLKFLNDYRLFMLNSYPIVLQYYSGETDEIDNTHLNFLSKLTKDCVTLGVQFKNFSSKFSTCGYWELMELVEALTAAVEKINKLPKFLRTSKTKYGYKPYIQVDTTVGGLRTMEEVANSIKNVSGENSDWIDLMLNNDLNESDWEIDELKSISAFVNNATDIVVTTILDQPIRERIYGKDICKNITFVDNDLDIVLYKDNIDQKCAILLELNRGDVPENPLFGKDMSLISGSTVKQFSYPILVEDITNIFMQNDLFEYVNVKGFKFSEGDMTLTCDIKTKYDYKTEQKITI